MLRVYLYFHNSYRRVKYKPYIRSNNKNRLNVYPYMMTLYWADALARTPTLGQILLFVRMAFEMFHSLAIQIIIA